MRVRRLALTLCSLTACAAFGGVAFGGAAFAGPAAKPDCSGLPVHRGLPVVDAANVVAPEAEAWLSVDLAMYHASGHEAIVAATVSNLGGDDVSSYATRLFDCWGIGDAKSDNGVLILVAMRERRVRIELGAGLAGRLTDGQLEAAIATMKAPLRGNDVGAALRSAAVTVVRDLGGTLPDTKSGNPGSVPSMIGPGDTAGDAPDDVSPSVVPYPAGQAPGSGYGPFDSADEPGSGVALVVVAFVFGLIVTAVRIVSAIGSSGGGGVLWRGGFPGYGRGHWGTPSILHRGTWHDSSPSDVFSGSGGGGGGGFGGSSGGSSGSFGGGSSGGGGASGSW